MKATELIVELAKCIATYGDLDIYGRPDNRYGDHPYPIAGTYLSEDCEIKENHRLRGYITKDVFIIE